MVKEALPSMVNQKLSRGSRPAEELRKTGMNAQAGQLAP